jgi:hypothetical protein
MAKRAGKVVPLDRTKVRNYLNRGRPLLVVSTTKSRFPSSLESAAAGLKAPGRL